MASDLQEVSDESLAADHEKKQHDRKQRVLNAMTTIAIGAIYTIPLVLGILYLLVLLHEAFIGNWDSLGSTIQGMIIPVITYLIGVLSNSGILPRNGKN